ncbi:MAG: hypothetical protein HYR96_10075 [Deltaproteobacteria bacterium]|nr:hypothetical protein [Deltaproteobacteria bacterium]
MKYLICAIVIVGCVKKAPDTVTQPVGEPKAQGMAVITSDYTTGEALLLWPGEPIKRVDVVPDARAVVPAERPNDLVIVGRYGFDHLRILDRRTGAVKGEYSVGRGRNAQDALFVTSEIVYVTNHESNALWVARIDANAQLVESKDLYFSSIGEKEAAPARAYTMGRFGHFVVVSVQALDKAFVPGDSRVVVLDVNDPWNPKETSHLSLSCKNPVTDLVSLPDASILVGGANKMGVYSELDGCVERLDLAGDGSISTKGAVVTEVALGGDIIALRLIDADTGVALVAASSEESKAVLFSISGARGVQKLGSFAGRGTDLLPFGKQIFVAVADFLAPALALRDLDGKTPQSQYVMPKDLLPPQQAVWLGEGR